MCVFDVRNSGVAQKGTNYKILIIPSIFTALFNPSVVKLSRLTKINTPC